MNSETRQISLLDHIGPAIEHTKAILFSPFDLNRWLTIGFCAWLATLGENSGSNFNYEKHSNETDQVVTFMTQHPMLIGSLVVVGIVLSVVFLWLSSRGRFMLYHCVLYNTAQVTHPWHYYQHLASSLFRFRLALMLIVLAYTLVMVVTFTSIFGPVWEITNLETIGPFMLFLPILIILPICVGLCDVLTNDFVLPIMHKHTLTCKAAWGKIWTLIGSHKTDVFLYILFKILFAVAIGAALFIVGLLTCGCACCLTALPYIGTVILLPIFTFKRSFSLLYLRQFGQDFDVFVTPSTPVEQEVETTEEPPNDYCI